MAKSRPPLKSRAGEKFSENLVADQPGKSIILSGLMIAFIVGFTLRGLIAPQKIREKAREAAERIHKDVKADFENAYVSLSKNGIPRLAVVINKVEMSSEKVCWGKPLLRAKQIELPVSLLALIFDKQPFRKIFAHEVEVDFRSPREPCGEEVEIKKVAKDNLATTQAVTLAKPRKSTESPMDSSLDGLEIDYLKINYLPVTQEPIEVVDLNLLVKSQQPKVVVLDAKTHLVKNPILQDFVSHGKVHLEYKEFPEQDLSLHFFGNWREGNYSLNATYNFADTNLSSNVELKHIPGSQVISVLKTYGWLREDYDGRQIWVTMKGQTQGTLKEWQKLPLIISDFQVEGDIGELQIPYFQAMQLKPFVFKPMKAQVKKLNIDKLLAFLKRPRQLTFIGKLGEFNGQLELLKEDELKLSGNHTGLEFIFSRLGQRQAQTISSLKGDFTMKNNRWNLQVKDIKLDQGKFDGDLKLGADRDFKDIEVKLLAKELVLSPAVQRLVSGGGQIPSVSSEIQASIQGGQVQNLKGNLSAPKMTIDKMGVERFNSQFESKNGSVNVQFQAQQVQVNPSANTYDLFRRILKQEAAPTDFKISRVNGALKMTPEEELKWQTSGILSELKATQISSEGSWNKLGFLNGQIFVRGAAKGLWYVSGHRDEPKITEANGTRSASHQ
jgi:hypothetical protein